LDDQHQLIPLRKDVEITNSFVAKRIEKMPSEPFMYLYVVITKCEFAGEYFSKKQHDLTMYLAKVRYACP
jgi:hypothetical protein